MKNRNGNRQNNPIRNPQNRLGFPQNSYHNQQNHNPHIIPIHDDYRPRIQQPQFKRVQPKPNANRNNDPRKISQFGTGFKPGDFIADEDFDMAKFDMHVVDQKKIKQYQMGGIFNNDRRQIDDLNERSDLFESQIFNANIPTYKPRKEEDNGPVISLADYYNFNIEEEDENYD